jgi:hypothetical protein
MNLEDRSVDMINVVQDIDQWRSLVSTLTGIRVPLKTGDFVTSCATNIISKRTLLHGVSI